MSVIALIAAGGVCGLLVLLVTIALIIDLPKRMKRRQNKGVKDIEQDGPAEITEVEKGSANVSEAEVSITTNASTNYTSARPARPASPECQCEHPAISHNAPRI